VSAVADTEKTATDTTKKNPLKADLLMLNPPDAGFFWNYPDGAC
jgi:hypothetical protein